MPSLLQKLEGLRFDLAQAAQLVVDEWSQNEEGFDEDLGNGGVCDLVSQAMSGVIYGKIDNVEILDGGHDGDDHAWLIVVDANEAVGVDIPPGVYETGGGYSWKKIKNVEIEPTDVVLWDIDRRDIMAACRNNDEDDLRAALSLLEIHVRQEGVEAVGPEDQVDMIAFDMGYQGDSMPDWIKFLGKKFNVDVFSSWDDGRRSRTASVLDVHISSVAARRPNVGWLVSKNGEMHIPLLPVEETNSVYVADFDGRKVRFPKKTLQAEVDGVSWTLTDTFIEGVVDSLDPSAIDNAVLIDKDPDFRAVLRVLNSRGFITYGSCSGHADKPGAPYISMTADPETISLLSRLSFVKSVRPDPARPGATFVSFDRTVIEKWHEVLDYVQSILGSKDLHAEIAVRVAAAWVFQGRFVFQGRTYDMKIRSDGQGAVVYQKSPKCLFAKDGDEWFLQAGSKTIFDAAMSHMKHQKVASEEHDNMRLQPGPAFHLQPDGTWAVEAVPPDVAKEARFSGFLAIEGYWCVVFELGGEAWAQKAAGDMPEAEAKLASIARRIARVNGSCSKS
jgi:hypothetical protein